MRRFVSVVLAVVIIAAVFVPLYLWPDRCAEYIAYAFVALAGLLLLCGVSNLIYLFFWGDR